MPEHTRKPAARRAPRDARPDNDRGRPPYAPGPSADAASIGAPNKIARTASLGPSDDVTVEVNNFQTQSPIESREIRDLVRRVLYDERVDRAQISVAVVDDATIHELNRRHLAHDCPTDVITFVLSDDDSDDLSGEIVVSAETAERVARAAGNDPEAELTLYLVHGLLHLLGCDDRTPAAASEMRRRESEVLARLGVENCFAKSRVVAENDSSVRDREDRTCPA
jgi:probable rRNA maturation factor